MDTVTTEVPATSHRVRVVVARTLDQVIAQAIRR